MAAVAVLGGNDAGCEAGRQKDMNHRINGLARAVNHEEQLAAETAEQKGNAPSTLKRILALFKISKTNEVCNCQFECCYPHKLLFLKKRKLEYDLLVLNVDQRRLQYY